MSNVLVLKSSISGNNAQTNQLADYVIEKLQGNHIVVRDLAQHNHFHILMPQQQRLYAVNLKMMKKNNFLHFPMN